MHMLRALAQLTHLNLTRAFSLVGVNDAMQRYQLVPLPTGLPSLRHLEMSGIGWALHCEDALTASLTNLTALSFVSLPNCFDGARVVWQAGPALVPRALAAMRGLRMLQLQATKTSCGGELELGQQLARLTQLTRLQFVGVMVCSFVACLAPHLAALTRLEHLELRLHCDVPDRANGDAAIAAAAVSRHMVALTRLTTLELGESRTWLGPTVSALLSVALAQLGRKLLGQCLDGREIAALKRLPCGQLRLNLDIVRLVVDEVDEDRCSAFLANVA
jgi:hypothetical protein